jgi:hypothetical protein
MWDTRALGKRLKNQSIDAGNSPLIPLYDPDSEIMLLTGRVHTNILETIKSSITIAIILTFTHLFPICQESVFYLLF